MNLNYGHKIKEVKFFIKDRTGKIKYVIIIMIVRKNVMV